MTDQVGDIIEVVNKLYAIPFVLGEISIGAIVAISTGYVIYQGDGISTAVLSFSWILWIAIAITFWFFGYIVNSYSISSLSKRIRSDFDEQILYHTASGQKAVLSFGVTLATLYSVFMIALSFGIDIYSGELVLDVREKILLIFSLIGSSVVSASLCRHSIKRLRSLSIDDEQKIRSSLSAVEKTQVDRAVKESSVVSDIKGNIAEINKRIDESWEKIRSIDANFGVRFSRIEKSLSEKKDRWGVRK